MTDDPDEHTWAYAPTGREHFYVGGGSWSDEPLLGLCLDTWYFDYIDKVGILPIGEQPLTTSAGVGAFLARRLLAFLQACAGPVRCRFVAVNYKDALDDTMIRALHIAGDEPSVMARELEARVATSSHVFVGTYAVFDLYVTIRGFDGTLRSFWLERMGALASFGEWQPPDQPPLRATDPVPWQSTLSLSVASLFRRDNAAELAHARTTWQRYRATDPDLLTLPSEETNLTLVTLAEPPPSTRPDNHQLYEQNAPRLRAAVAQWEQATGHPFEWAIDLDA